MKTAKPKIATQVRWMIRRDMPQVLEIEADSFPNPWTEEEFYRCLRQRNCIGMVAEAGDEIHGYMIYELHAGRIHLLSMAVRPAMRKAGIASLMVERMIAKLSANRRHRIACEVRETNVAAQLFFRSRGFKAVSVLKDFYDDTSEDAYLFQYSLRSQ